MNFKTILRKGSRKDSEIPHEHNQPYQRVRQGGWRSKRVFYNFPYASPSTPSDWRSAGRISVVIPVYNHAAYIQHSLDSILSQECDLEVVVVNDGSTDQLETAIAPYLSDPRVCYVTQENQGIAAALNAGFSHTHYPFLTWTSADNAYKPGALPAMRDYLLANPSVGLVYANVELIDEDGSPFIDKTHIDGLYFNGGWCYGGFKATPASGFCYAHLLANDTPHPTAAQMRLDRFSRGAPIDEKGAGAQPNLH